MDRTGSGCGASPELLFSVALFNIIAPSVTWLSVILFALGWGSGSTYYTFLTLLVFYLISIDGAFFGYCGYSTTCISCFFYISCFFLFSLSLSSSANNASVILFLASAIVSGAFGLLSPASGSSAKPSSKLSSIPSISPSSGYFLLSYSSAMSFNLLKFSTPVFLHS